MSDPNTPPKPKPGSLRDRIAAFENKAAASQPAGPPPPRPKPAGFATWKPKQPSPPDSPTASPSTGSGATEGVVRAGVGAMNATDAKESITRAGGSLKERMAALQGRGGFGGSAPPSTPPKPAAENKPKWKPPPAVVPTPAIGEDDEAEKLKEEGGEPEGEVLTSPKPSSVKSPPIIVRSPESGLEEESEGDKEPAGEVAGGDDGQGEDNPEKEETQADEEEEERQRRAAIAARMAKLGGARIGMGPPLFSRPGIPPPAKKASAEPEPLKAEEEAPVETTTETTAEQELSPRPPTSMPVPAMPKRTGPPRRKSAKSTSPGVTSAEESPVPPAEIPVSLAEESAEPAIVPSDAGDVIAPVEAVQVPSDTAEEVKDDEGGQDLSISPSQPAAEVEVKESEPKEEQPQEAQAEEEDEETRKKRVAEKLAKMGGVNPFALPSMPIRRTSAGSVGSPPTSPPPPVRKSSIGSPPPPPEKPASLRRDSSGSVAGRRASAGSIEGPAAAGTGTGAGVARRSSVGSVKSIKKVDEVEGIKEIVEEPESVIPESEEGEVVASGSPPGAVDVEKPVKKPSVDDDDEHSKVAEHGKEQDQDENTLYARESQYDNSTHDIDYDDVTPRPPPRVPLIASAVSDTTTTTTSAVVPQAKHDGSSSVPRSAAEQDSHHQRSDSDNDGMVDPRVVASVIPPPPSRSPPRKGSYSDTITTASVPLPPRIVPEPSRRESSGERLSGPSQPRRLVTQSPPEQSRRELDYEIDAGEEVRAGRDEVVGDDGGEESGSELTHSTLFVPPPKAVTGTDYRTLARGGEVDDGEESEPPLHVPPPGALESAGSGLGVEGRGPSEDRDTDSTSNTSGAPLPVRMNVGGSTKPSRSVPPPPPPPAPLPVPTQDGEVEESASEYDDEGDDYQQEEVLRTRPLSEKLDRGEVPLIVPPPPPVSAGTIHAPSRGVPAPPPEEVDKEVLDEDEGDPIDPAFYSPSTRNSYIGPQAQTQPPQADQVQASQGQGQNLARASTSSLSPSSAANVPRPPVPVDTEVKLDEDTEPKEEGAEKDKKQTIAERMARLGGIKFGAAPVSGRPPIPVPRKSSGEHSEAKAEDEEEPEQPSHGAAREEAGGGDEEENEEEERARRERIAAKLAGMGGMRIGMMPMAAPPRQSHILHNEPQAVPAPGKGGSGASESGASEDGVKVEAEESEMEEVGYEDVKGSEEGSGEEVPPPPPARPAKRRETGQSITTPSTPLSIPPPPTTRPPVPVPVPFRRASVKSATQTNIGQQGPSQQSEYVIIDEPKVASGGGGDAGEAAPPPPPARPPHRAPPPTRMAPSAPAASLADSISSQWELPAIPSSSLGGDLSASWSDALDDSQLSTPQPPSQPAPVPVPPQAAPAPKSPEALHLNADDLMAMWGRVGVQICEIATTMHDQSKKTLVGDGTYRGFVDAVLREVPNAARPQSKQIPYGYLVYVQNGTQVQKRASEIMPGDVIELVDARFKGHKGLGSYQLHVGAGEAEGGTGPVVGIVSEFEPKKSKTRVFQANQHVGQQTVEAASYRLEDLKSGLVKVYRVLEA